MELESVHCSNPVKKHMDLKPGDVALANGDKLPNIFGKREELQMFMWVEMERYIPVLSCYLPGSL